MSAFEGLFLVGNRLGVGRCHGSMDLKGKCDSF
jgi:hypothetical protein